MKYCIENADVVCLINIQKRKKDGKLFLSFLSCKNRYKETELKYFNQPFDEETFNLVDDLLEKKPAGLVSLSTDFEDVELDMYKSRGRKMHVYGDGTDDGVIDDMNLFSLTPVA